MAEATIDQQFHGTCALVLLHLRRVAHSNDLDAGFAAARELRMISDEHERFIRSCLELDDSLQAGGQVAQPITPALIKELQACVLRLNSADPA